MKKIVWILGFLLIVLIGAAAVLPGMMDWNRFKPEIQSRLNDALGMPVEIEGDLAFTLLPVPHLSVDGIRIQGAERVVDDPLLRLEKLSAHAALWPLMTGRLEVASLRLVQPHAVLAVGTEGQSNWSGKTALKPQDSEAEQPQDAAETAGLPIAFQNIQIQGGQVDYVDLRSPSNNFAVRNISGRISADSLQGPFQATLEMESQGKSLRIEGSTGGIEAQAIPVNLELRVLNPENIAELSLSYKGVVDMKPANTAGWPEIQGETKLSTPDLQAALVHYAGLNVSDLAGLQTSRSMTLNGLLSYDGEGLKFENLRWMFDPLELSGHIVVAPLGPDRLSPRVEARLEQSAPLAWKDLRRIYAPSQNANDSGNREFLAALMAKEGEKVEWSAPAQGLLPPELRVPQALKGELSLNLAELTYNETPLRDLSFALKSEGKSFPWRLGIGEAPGSVAAQLEGALRYGQVESDDRGFRTFKAPSLDATLQASGQDLHATLGDWLGLKPVKEIPARQLKNATLKAALSVGSKKLDLKVSELSFDKTRADASFVYTYSEKTYREPHDLALDLNINGFDAALYNQAMPSPVLNESGSDGGADKSKKEAQVQRQLLHFLKQPGQTFLKHFSDVTWRVNLAGQNLALQADMPIESLALSVKQDVSEMIRIEKAQIEAPELPFTAAMDGEIHKVYSPAAEYDLRLNASTPDAEAFAKKLELPKPPIDRPLRRVEVASAFRGALEDAEWTSSFDLLDATLNTTARLRAGEEDEKIRLNNLRIRARHPDLGLFLQAAFSGYEAHHALSQKLDFFAEISRLEAKRYAVRRIRSEFGPLSVSGDLVADLAGDVPVIQGKVQAGSLDLDHFLGGGTGSNKKQDGEGRTASDGPPEAVWSRNALDLSFMHAFEADIDFNARALRGGGLNFENLAAKLILNDGLLNIQKADARLFEGGFGMTGTLTAPTTKEKPVRFKTDMQLKQANLGPLTSAFFPVRGGTSMALAEGTIDSQMNFQSSGVSPAALIFNLSGKIAAQGQDIVVNGIDLNEMSASLANADNPASALRGVLPQAMRGGSTYFDTFNLQSDVEEGVAKIQDMKLAGPAGVLAAAGNVNLPKWTMDINGEISLRRFPEAPPFAIRISGPLDSPDRGFVTRAFRDYLKTLAARKLESIVRDKLKQKMGGGNTETEGEDTNASEDQSGADQQQGSRDAVKDVLRGLIER